MFVVLRLRTAESTALRLHLAWLWLQSHLSSEQWREEATGQVFEIKWQPAIIGRPDGNNPASANMLAVNLGPLEGSKAVSRHHAGITEQDGQYFVESMSSNNPTYLNDGLIRSGERRFLESGDKIRVGHFVLTFEIQKE